MTDPILPRGEFETLRLHFEAKLSRLPPEIRPESMDVPHFTDLYLFRWLCSDSVLDLVEPIIGPNIALFSSHFICKPTGNGKRVPWHEDSSYWKWMLEPMQAVTVWLAIDSATPENGCMFVIPRSHAHGYSEYEPVDPAHNVFQFETKASQRDESKAVACELEANQASLHDGRLMHGSPPNTSDHRRCGYTMRYMSTAVKFIDAVGGSWHQIYLARGRDLAGNHYADPNRRYPHLARYRELAKRSATERKDAPKRDREASEPMLPRPMHYRSGSYSCGAAYVDRRKPTLVFTGIGHSRCGHRAALPNNPQRIDRYPVGAVVGVGWLARAIRAIVPVDEVRSPTGPMYSRECS